MTANIPPTNITMKIRAAALIMPPGMVVASDTRLAARAGLSLASGGAGANRAVGPAILGTTL